MDYKLDYMTRLFAKICKKKTETYVINRIWHQLNDDRVKFVVQQYIRKTQDKYALADLYLPQLNIFIEINEPFHKNNKEVDKIRNEEILQVTHSHLEIIDCNNSIEVIHSQISEVVQKIKVAIKEQGNKFIPWDGGSTLSVEYHQRKGYLKIDDNEYIHTIDEAFAVFGAKAKHRGFLRVAGATIPNKENWIVWCPNSVHRIWSNELSDDGLAIREYNKANEQLRKEHVERFTSINQTRITFFRDEDELGFRFYRFAGIFEINKEKSIQENKCVWECISDYYEL
jgi:very-short-patch-repair endonuclease